MMRTVLITGASRGIGRSTAEAFAEDGWCVAAAYNSGDAEALSLKKELTDKGKTINIYKADLADAKQAASLVHRTVKDFGRLDAVVNNAGIWIGGLITDITDEELEKITAVNYYAPFIISREAARYMVERKNGVIINVSSIWGISGASCEVCYSASKSAVIGLTKALAAELGPSNIRVNCVAPGVIATDMCAGYTEEEMNDLKEATPLCRIGTPGDIAQSILFLASEKASFITGQVLSPNGGFLI